MGCQLGTGLQHARAVEEEQGEVILLLLRDPRINPNQQVVEINLNPAKIIRMMLITLFGGIHKADNIIYLKIQDNVGLSPLHVAVLLHLPHFAALLLAHTAIDPNIR